MNTSNWKTISESGHCNREFRDIVVLYEVFNHIVCRVSCKHETCKWRSKCKLYQAHPIGSIVD